MQHTSPREGTGGTECTADSWSFSSLLCGDMLDWVCRWYSPSCASPKHGGRHDHCTSRSSSSSSHACKPSPTPHYISHMPLSLCNPHSLSFHADTSDAHDTPDTCAIASDENKDSLSVAFPPVLTPATATRQVHTNAPSFSTRLDPYHYPLLTSHVLHTHVFHPPRSQRGQCKKSGRRHFVTIAH